MKAYGPNGQVATGSIPVYVGVTPTLTPTPTPTPTPTQAYSLTITSPNGGESYVDNSSPINIQWTSSGNISTINLYYISNNLNSWGINDTALQNTGSYLWTPHTNFPKYILYKIGIQGYDAGGNTVADDRSDDYFTISQLTPTPTPVTPMCNDADINQDGVVNVSDLSPIAQYYLEHVTKKYTRGCKS